MATSWFKVVKMDIFSSVQISIKVELDSKSDRLFHEYLMKQFIYFFILTFLTSRNFFKHSWICQILDWPVIQITTLLNLVKLTISFTASLASVPCFSPFCIYDENKCTNLQLWQTETGNRGSILTIMKRR